MRGSLVWACCFLYLGGLSGREVLGTETRRSDCVVLNGTWEFALGDGSEAAQTRSGQKSLLWRPVKLPGRFPGLDYRKATEIRFVWIRRSFEVSSRQARRLAVLRWNRIDYGATAFINGRKVGYNESTGPYFVLLEPGTLKPGKNQIVLKIPGTAGVRRSRSGKFLFPAGLIWGEKRPRLPAVTDEIWIDFADQVYMKWILAIPDLAKSSVRIRVTLAGRKRLDGLKVTAEVRPWPEGDVIGSGVTNAWHEPVGDPLGGRHFYVGVPMPGFKPWTFEHCNLYTADVRVLRGNKVLDRVTIRFGMREIRVVGGDYKLNGRTLWIRGSNLVHEWTWGNVITGKERAYLVDEARELSINAFRTHTQPPPQLWADICDEHGTMILAEFPVLYNYRNPHFTSDEWEEFHRNVLLDTAGWMARLWNHPSVIIWVLSNESIYDNEWEEGPFRDFVIRLDPTRPTMRTGTTGTKTNFDVHTCGNTNHWTNEGRMHVVVSEWFKKAGDRTVTNSEYMNIFKRPVCQWTGTEDPAADRLAYAQLGMEHTEVMRRARVDAILPYMYAGWTRTRTGRVWKAGYAQPISAVWHSALSPVLASLDLFDANYLVGREVTTDLYLINDSWHPAKIHVDLLLTHLCPEFIPEAECFNRPIAKWSYDFELPADSIRKTPVRWKLPNEPGTYWLTARMTGIPGRPVLSQRFVRAVVLPRVPDSVRNTAFVILGDDHIRREWFRDRGLSAVPMRSQLEPGKHVVVLWNPAKLTEGERAWAEKLCRFAAAGGRIVVLSARTWSWPELCDIEIDRMNGSRVFPYKGVLPDFLRNINLDCLKRWNGLPGTVAVASLKGRALEAGKRFLWVREPRYTVVAELPCASRTGRLVFSQLSFRRHCLRGKPAYDPVAEQILINLLEK